MKVVCRKVVRRRGLGGPRARYFVAAAAFPAGVAPTVRANFYGNPFSDTEVTSCNDDCLFFLRHKHLSRARERINPNLCNRVLLPHQPEIRFARRLVAPPGGRESDNALSGSHFNSAIDGSGGGVIGHCVRELPSRPGRRGARLRGRGRGAFGRIRHGSSSRNRTDPCAGTRCRCR